ncbi:MAG: TRAP transporter substrate-binding protein [Burkholderiales bacterium]|nr:TRAP transporter substrate-binding protein [Burkholderiales bacterium]
MNRILAGLVLWIFSFSALAQFQDRTLRFGIGLNEDHPQGQSVLKFAEIVARESGNKINIQLFGGGKLGNDASMIADLQSGKLDMTAPDSSNLVKLNKGFGALNLPFLLDTEEEADWLLLQGSYGRQMLGTLPQHGLVGLTWWENGFRHMTNNKRPINKASDFSALKVRVIPNPLFTDIFQALGAEPIPMPFPQVYEGLKAAKVDGQENPLITIYNSKFFEVQNNLSLTRHVYSAWVVLISKRLWDTFSVQEKALFQKAASETAQFERKLIREASQKVLLELQKLGMKVSEPSRAEMARIRQLNRSVIQKYRREYGEDAVGLLYQSLTEREVKRFLESK